jgi:glycine/D-amino acid oxidase-like deaminating enzyme
MHRRSKPAAGAAGETLRYRGQGERQLGFTVRLLAFSEELPFPLRSSAATFKGFDMRVIVLGAGLLGVTSAYYLQQLGHEVTVIDRQATPAAETSFANGGQISVSHAEPWANPSAPLKVLQWLGKEDAPLLFRIRADMRQWLWGLQFLRECSPARTRHNIGQIVRLGTYSRETLQQLRADTGLAYEQRTQGTPRKRSSTVC